MATNLTTGVCKHHLNLFCALKIKIQKNFWKISAIRPSCIESQILGFWLGLMDGTYLYMQKNKNKILEIIFMVNITWILYVERAWFWISGEGWG